MRFFFKPWTFVVALTAGVLYFGFGIRDWLWFVTAIPIVLGLRWWEREIVDKTPSAWGSKSDAIQWFVR